MIPLGSRLELLVEIVGHSAQRDMRHSYPVSHYDIHRMTANMRCPVRMRTSL